MRLFIAIPLNAEMKGRMKQVQDAFRRLQVKGNYTPPGNLHIALAFIGEYSDPEAVMAALKPITFAPFRVRLDELGSFGELYWAGCSENKELEALAGKVRHALADAGIPYDKKKFKAHVTILRKPEYAGKRKPPFPDFAPAEMPVTKVSLMQAVRGNNEMIYTEVGAVHTKS